MKKGYITANGTTSQGVDKEKEIQLNHLEIALYQNCTYDEIADYFLNFYDEFPNRAFFNERVKIKEKLEKAFKDRT